MSILDELFDLYQESNTIKVKAQAIRTKNPLEFGDVVEIYYNNKQIIATIIDESEAILMSEFWEFATNTDMIVNFEHPISNKWIIELDKRLFLEGKDNISYHSCLSQEDKDMLKKVLDGAELPPQKTGSRLPVNTIDPRWKFRAGEIEKITMFNKNLFFE